MIQPKTHPPEAPEPSDTTLEKFFTLIMQIVKRQDDQFFESLRLERIIRNIDAGFVLTSFEQASIFKAQTHAMIEDLNGMVATLELRKRRANHTHESTAE